MLSPKMQIPPKTVPPPSPIAMNAFAMQSR